MTNLVTLIPDYLDISDWYELVEGDAIPNGGLTIVLYPGGDVRIIRETYGYQSVRQIKSSLKAGFRFFTPTPVPTAIKRASLAKATPQPWEVHIKDVETVDGKRYAQLVRLDQSTFVNPYNSGERPLIDWIAKYTCVSTNQDAMVECDKRDRKIGSYRLEWLNDGGVWHCPDVGKYYDSLALAGSEYGWIDLECFRGMRFADEA